MYNRDNKTRRGRNKRRDRSIRSPYSTWSPLIAWRRWIDNTYLVIAISWKSRETKNPSLYVVVYHRQSSLNDARLSFPRTTPIIVQSSLMFLEYVSIILWRSILLGKTSLFGRKILDAIELCLPMLKGKSHSCYFPDCISIRLFVIINNSKRLNG